MSKYSVLEERQLKRLKEHKYSSIGSTFLDRYMQVWWEWVVHKLPLWLAPNTMTLAGLIVVVLTSIIFIIYSPDAKQDLPSWSMFLAALSIFIYQTLDACDGKQARRTQTQSQLGELFDHGCDSLSTIFISLIVSIACKHGFSPQLLFFQCCFAICLFYTAHWQTFVSGSLRFGKFDVTEIQLSIMSMLIVTGIFGNSIWTHRLPILDLQLNIAPIIFSIVGGLFAIFDNFSIILSGGVGKNGSSVAGTSILSPSIPLLCVVVPSVVIMRMSPSSLYESNPTLYLLLLGLISTKITIKLIICHMSRTELAYFDSSMTGLILLFLNQYFYCIIDEYIVLWVAFVYSLYDLIRYSSLLCQDISTYLNIYTFSIAKKDPSLNHYRTPSGNFVMNSNRYSTSHRTSQTAGLKTNGERRISRRGQS